jgi:hypothetical protein
MRQLVALYQFFWMLESNAQQRLAWEDAAEARIARARAERQAAAQLHAMLLANPSGALGDARLNDRDKLERSGLRIPPVRTADDQVFGGLRLWYSVRMRRTSSIP